MLHWCMAKARSVKRSNKTEAAAARKPMAKRTAAPPRERAAAAVVEAAEEEHVDEESLGEGSDRQVLCRSCGKRPGRPTAILGQMTQAELCPQCTALRKESIRLNRAAARGMRSSRLF